MFPAEMVRASSRQQKVSTAAVPNGLENTEEAMEVDASPPVVKKGRGRTSNVFKPAVDRKDIPKKAQKSANTKTSKETTKPSHIKNTENGSSYSKSKIAENGVSNTEHSPSKNIENDTGSTRAAPSEGTENGSTSAKPSPTQSSVSGSTTATTSSTTQSSGRGRKRHAVDSAQQPTTKKLKGKVFKLLISVIKWTRGNIYFHIMYE